MGTIEVPIYQAKAELFRTLGHPVRIRVLELLVERPQVVRDLLADLEIEASNLSQQLAVLRRVGLVTSSRHDGIVEYRLAAPEMADLLTVGRAVLAELPRDADD